MEGKLNLDMIEVKTCKIPVSRYYCEEARLKCSECPNNTNCDYYWISELWSAENKELKKNSLLGPLMPASLKPDMRNQHVISVTGKYDFCCFNVPKSKPYVVISDIYVNKAARGQGISKKLLDYLMTTYDRDIFAKCVRGTTAEDFWSYLGVQLDANDGRGPDKYEHRLNKRDLGWYVVENNNKKQAKGELW